MKKYNKGFVVPLLLAIIGILIVGGGTYIYTQKTSNSSRNVEQDSPQNQSTADWKSYANSQYGFEAKYPNGWQVLPSVGTLTRIAFGQTKNIGTAGYDGEWFVFVYSDSEININNMRKSLGEETEHVSINGVSALRLVKGNYESILVKKNGKNYWIHNGNNKNDLFPKFYNSLKFTSVVVAPTAGVLPNLIKNVTVNIENGDQRPENDPKVLSQIKNDIQNGKLSWFIDPVEVSKKYGSRFSIASNSQYSLEQAAMFGGDSGVMHSTVLATNATKSYRIYLIAEPTQPYIWVINTVTDIQQSNKLRVDSFSPASTFDVDGISHQDIVKRFGDVTILYYLNVKKPLVTFNLNQPANPNSVNSDSIIVKVNGTVLSGATAKAITEQGSSHGATFLTHSIQVDLSGVANLKNYAGQNIQIILTDKIKDMAGNSLQQCDRSYNKGECIADASGQKIKVFGAELRLYSL